MKIRKTKMMIPDERTYNKKDEKYTKSNNSIYLGHITTNIHSRNKK